MKYLSLLTALFLILVLAGCSEDDTPSVPLLTVNEKLNNRSAELYKQGTDVVEAAKIIKTEFTFDDDALLKSLYTAGYSSAELTKAIHLAYDYNPRLAEPILIEIITNKTVSDIAELILAEYTTELKLNTTDLKYFLQNIELLERRVLILKDIYEKLPQEILETLHSTDVEVTEIINLLINHFSLTEDDIKVIMLNEKLTAAEIAGVLRSIYSRTASEVMQFLNENSFSVSEALSALKELYVLTVNQASALLEELNFPASQIAAELLNVNYTFEEVGSLLKDHFSYTAEAAIALLKTLNASAENAADVLINIYGQTVPEAVVTLYNTGYTVDEILNVLTNHLSLGIQEIIDLMEYLDIDYCEVLQYFNIPC